MVIRAQAALAAKSPLQPYEYEPGPLAPDEVEVAVSHCGICHSDVHLVDNDWGMEGFPLVPGHEVVGKVTQVGSAVTTLQPGQRVGIGWQRASCGQCEFCLRGEENLCARQEATCVGHPGGFAERVRVTSRFAFPVPDALPSEAVGPLMCGGITVYSPLRTFGVQPAHRVGVVGIGGLGHMALQFARAMGCEVVAISATPDKEGEARRFGAHDFLASTVPGALEGRAGTLDFVLSTVMSDLDWTKYVNLLRPDGTLCFVGVPAKPLVLSVNALLSTRRRIAASPIGSPRHIREMLEFAARNRILPQVELAPLAEANAALDQVRRGKARYRKVLRV